MKNENQKNIDWTKKLQKNKRLGVRLDEGELKTILDISKEQNISISGVIRALINVLKIEELYSVKEWIFDASDNRDIEDVITLSKKKGETTNE